MIRTAFKSFLTGEEMREFLKSFFKLIGLKKRNILYDSVYESLSRNAFLRYLKDNKYLKRKDLK
jgi:hypothetical protein